MTSSTNNRGTVRYMAPELFSESTSKPDQATDIWALGCLFLVGAILTSPKSTMILISQFQILQEVVFEVMPYAHCRSEPQVISRIMKNELPHEAASLVTNDFVASMAGGENETERLRRLTEIIEFYDLTKKPTLYSHDILKYNTYLLPEALSKFQSFWEVCCQCWSVGPSSRPTALGVASDIMAYAKSDFDHDARMLNLLSTWHDVVVSFIIALLLMLGLILRML